MYNNCNIFFMKKFEWLIFVIPVISTINHNELAISISDWKKVGRKQNEKYWES